MSKFYEPGNVSSDEESEQQQNNKKNDKNDKKKFGMEDDDYHQEEKNKMQTEAEKKNSLFRKLSASTITAVNNRDFDKAWEVFQEFIKEIDKAAKFIEKEGFPNVFIKTLKIVNEQINSIDPETKKKMKNPKSFNIMKQKLKTKIVPEYKQKLDNFKQEEEVVKDVSEQSSSSSSSSSDSQYQEEEYYKKFLESDDPLVRRKYWLKREKRQESDEEKQKQKEKQKKQQKQKQKKDNQAVEPQQRKTKPKKFNIIEKKKENQQRIIASAKEAEEKIAKIWKQFRKLSKSDRREEYQQTLQQLNAILQQSKNHKDHEQISLLLVDVPIRILALSKIVKYNKQINFPRQDWNKVFKNMQSIFNKITETQDVDIMGKIAIFEEQNENATLGTNDKIVFTQLISYIISLDRELKKSFIYIENSEPEYSQRLQDLVKLIQFMYKLSKYISFKQGLQRETAQVTFMVLEKMHFMSNIFMDKISKSQNDLTFVELSDQNTIGQYVKPILKLNDQALTTKALLYLIFNHAVNRRDKAKDLLMLTDISQTILSRDYYTQICFNRALVQLAISAFYQGNLYQTQQILSNICSMIKNREQNKQNIRKFIGQNKFSQKDQSRVRIIPYYMHLNVDLIEAIELISSMILEIPFTLTEGGKITSRSFKKITGQYQKLHFIAQPLNFRDLVYAASNDLKLGNMKDCFEKLSEIGIWNQIGNPKQALQNLTNNIKQTALKCYILANKNCYRCLSLESLSKKFEMDIKTIKKIICKQINQKKINGVITSDGYLNLTQKPKQKQTGIRNISNMMFSKLDEINKVNEQIFKQKQDSAGAQQEQQVEKESKGARKLHQAITDKLKNILSRRAA